MTHSRTASHPALRCLKNPKSRSIHINMSPLRQNPTRSKKVRRQQQSKLREFFSNMAGSSTKGATSTESAESAPTATPLLLRFYHPSTTSSTPSPVSPHFTHAELLASNDTQLEKWHSYIQILFPLPEPSPFNFMAPVVTGRICAAFRADPALRQQLLRSFNRMLAFYGLAPSHRHRRRLDPDPDPSLPAEASTAEPPADNSNPTTANTADETNPETQAKEETNIPHPTQTPEPYTILPDPSTFPQRAPYWFTRFSHNHLRLTRILRSLRLLGCAPATEALYRCLVDLYEIYPGRLGQRSMIFWTRAARRSLWLAPEDEDGDEDEDEEEDGEGEGEEQEEGEEGEEGRAWLKGLNGRGDKGGVELGRWDVLWDESAGEVVWGVKMTSTKEG